MFLEVGQNTIIEYFLENHYIIDSIKLNIRNDPRKWILIVFTILYQLRCKMIEYLIEEH